MKKSILFIAASFALTGATSNHLLCPGFAPENDVQIPMTKAFEGLQKSSPMETGGIGELDFSNAAHEVIKAFAPEIKAAGGTVKLNMMWANPTANASTSRTGNTWIFNMYGGLARHEKMSVDGFRLVMCHELGHQIGGAPKNVMFWVRQLWSTNEGQSDYFATTKCLRRIFNTEETSELIRTQNINDDAKAECAKVWSNQLDADMCMRLAMASKSVAETLASLRPNSAQINFMTPDPSRVSKTFNAHPAAQCRLDTYFEGALCTAPANEMFANNNLTKGACIESTHEVGNRPRCWFRAPWHRN
jgi:hypothetical protein